MTQEDKELLLKDLCARLPYRTMVKCKTYDRHEFDEELSEMHIMNFYQFDTKPYLRLISSMTEEERKEYKHLVAFSGNPEGSANLVDWLNKKKFAYRTIDGKDMFELGLAFEALEGMYETEKQKD